MIYYSHSGFQTRFAFALRGSSFPRACLIALPSSGLAAVLRICLVSYPDYLSAAGIDLDLGGSQVWNVWNATLMLMLAFRVREAYNRLWEGLTLCHQMRGEWFDACSNLTAFAKTADINAKEKGLDRDFIHTVVRLMSLMHGTALHQIKESNNENFNVLGLDGLDDDTKSYLGYCKNHGLNRVEVLLHWMQVLIVDNIEVGVLTTPPPIISRIFQELSRGMVHLNDAKKITETPFPFPLAQLTTMLLLMHCMLTPISVCMFVGHPVWAALVTFISVGSMWTIYLSAAEIEQPFGEDVNDLPLSMLQDEFNRSLVMLLDPRAQQAPSLKESPGALEICVEMPSASLPEKKRFMSEHSAAAIPQLSVRSRRSSVKELLASKDARPEQSMRPQASLTAAVPGVAFHAASRIDSGLKTRARISTFSHSSGLNSTTSADESWKPVSSDNLASRGNTLQCADETGELSTETEELEGFGQVARRTSPRDGSLFRSSQDRTGRIGSDGDIGYSHTAI